MKTAVFIFIACCWGANISFAQTSFTDNDFLAYRVDPQTEKVKFYWKDNEGNIIYSFQRLDRYLLKEGDSLIFAMNGGMYNRNHAPQGLYIENGNIINPMDTLSMGYGNFYMQPNGIFYIDSNNAAHVTPSKEFVRNDVTYATQSGPMLLINGTIHSKFKENSNNLNIRNGVGILPDGKILFVMSKKKINFYDFATYFKNKGCSNALYLDGFVSRVYFPEKNWTHQDGRFGVIIGVTK